MLNRNKLMYELKALIEDENVLVNNIITHVKKKRVVREEVSSEDAIMALRDTDYRDQSAYFKMLELLKGIAVASKDDEKAAMFLNKVSDYLTKAAEKVIGDGKDEEDDDDGDGEEGEGEDEGEED